MSLSKVALPFLAIVLIAAGFLLTQKKADSGSLYREFGQNCQIQYVSEKMNYPLSSSGIAISKNEASVAYIKHTGSTMKVVFNGKSGKDYKWVYDLVISEDGKHILYRAEDGTRGWIIVKNEVPLEKKKVLSVSNLALSKTGKHSAYIVNTYSWEVTLNASTVEYAVLDGKEWTKYAQIQQSLFSPNEEHFAYRAQKANGKWVAVLDGKESPEYEQITNIAFNPKTSQFIYKGIDSGKIFAVHGNKKIKNIAEIEQLNIQPMPYKMQRNEKWIVVRNGKESQVYDHVLFVNAFIDTPFYFLATKGERAFRISCP